MTDSYGVKMETKFYCDTSKLKNGRYGNLEVYKSVISGINIYVNIKTGWFTEKQILIAKSFSKSIYAGEHPYNLVKEETGFEIIHQGVWIDVLKILIERSIVEDKIIQELKVVKQRTELEADYKLLKQFYKK